MILLLYNVRIINYHTFCHCALMMPIRYHNLGTTARVLLTKSKFLPSTHDLVQPVLCTQLVNIKFLITREDRILKVPRPLPQWHMVVPNWSAHP